MTYGASAHLHKVFVPLFADGNLYYKGGKKAEDHLLHRKIRVLFSKKEVRYLYAHVACCKPLNQMEGRVIFLAYLLWITRKIT